MTRERLAVIDQGTLLAERILGDGDVLPTLIVGGQDKEAILQQVVSELGNDPVAQAGFLRKLFQTIAIDGGPEITKKRNIAMTILTDPTEYNVRLTEAMVPLVEANPTVVRDAYISAVQQQTRENDPFSGSIAALLEAGKAIAPYLSQDAQTRRQIIDTWEMVKEQFPIIGERFQIFLGLNKIKLRMHPVTQSDRDVEYLKQQGLSNAQITEQLGRKPRTIRASVSRLIAAGRIEPARKGKSEAVAQRDREVEKLRGQGLTIDQIAEQLGRKPRTIRASVSRLIAAGRIERIIGRSGDSATNLLKILQEFRASYPIGTINLQEIANQLGVSRERARILYDKLKQTHASLPPKAQGVVTRLSAEYLDQLDQEVTARMSQGMTVKQIAKELRVTIRVVRLSKKLSPQTREGGQNSTNENEKSSQ